MTGILKIKAVTGGLYLKNQDRQTMETIGYFKRNNVEKLLPSHCTELPALVFFYNEFNIKQVKTGMILEF